MVDNLSERKKLQGEAERGTTASSSTLVELLKAKQESVELAVSQEAYATRMICEMTKDYMAETEMTSREPNWTSGMESLSLDLDSQYNVCKIHHFLNVMQNQPKQKKKKRYDPLSCI